MTVSGEYGFRPGRGMRRSETLPLFDRTWCEGGHGATWIVVNRLRDAGLGEAEALLALQRWNRTDADPPWSDAELLHKVVDVYRQPTNRAT